MFIVADLVSLRVKIFIFSKVSVQSLYSWLGAKFGYKIGNNFDGLRIVLT